jgi:hypothetical protein
MAWAAFGVAWVTAAVLSIVYPRPLDWLDARLTGRWVMFLKRNGLPAAAIPYETGLTRAVTRISFPLTFAIMGLLIILQSN